MDKRTCKEALEALGFTVTPVNTGTPGDFCEFVLYKPKHRRGVKRLNAETELEKLGFYDYEPTAFGRALYVYGDVMSPVDDDGDYEPKKG